MRIAINSPDVEERDIEHGGGVCFWKPAEPELIHMNRQSKKNWKGFKNTYIHKSHSVAANKRHKNCYKDTHAQT